MNMIPRTAVVAVFAVAAQCVFAQDADWAVLLEKSPAYDSSGNVIEKLSGGTVVERISGHSSSKGKMYRCRVKTESGWKPDYFILEPALAMFTGPYDTAAVQDRDLIVNYCTLKGKIEDRRHQLKEEALRKNPHFEAYKKLANDLAEMESKTEQLVQKRDSIASTRKRSKANMERGKVDDELRRLRGDGATLMNKFKETETKYKQWQSANPAKADPGGSDPQINEWTRQVDAMKPAVSQIVDGI